MTDFRINFFTSIAHEFRTPLAIIEGAVNKLDAIKRGEQVGSQRSTIQMVKRGTTRLLRLVNELMEFRKITLAMRDSHFSNAISSRLYAMCMTTSARLPNKRD